MATWCLPWEKSRPWNQLQLDDVRDVSPLKSPLSHPRCQRPETQTHRFGSAAMAPHSTPNWQLRFHPNLPLKKTCSEVKWVKHVKHWLNSLQIRTESRKRMHDRLVTELASESPEGTLETAWILSQTVSRRLIMNCKGLKVNKAEKTCESSEMQWNPVTLLSWHYFALLQNRWSKCFNLRRTNWSRDGGPSWLQACWISSKHHGLADVIKAQVPGIQPRPSTFTRKCKEQAKVTKDFFEREMSQKLRSGSERE